MDYKEQEFNKPESEYYPNPPEYSPKKQPAPKAGSVATRKIPLKKLFSYLAATVMVGGFIVSGDLLGDAFREKEMPPAVETELTTTPGESADNDSIWNLIYQYKEDSPFYLQDEIRYYSMFAFDTGDSDSYYPSYEDNGVNLAMQTLTQDFISTRYSEIGQYFEDNKDEALKCHKEGGYLKPIDVSDWFDSSLTMEVDGKTYEFEITKVEMNVLTSTTSNLDGEFYCSDTYIEGDVKVGATGFYFNLSLRKKE